MSPGYIENLAGNTLILISQKRAGVRGGGQGEYSGPSSVVLHRAFVGQRRAPACRPSRFVHLLGCPATATATAAASELSVDLRCKPVCGSVCDSLLLFGWVEAALGVCGGGENC